MAMLLLLTVSMTHADELSDPVDPCFNSTIKIIKKWGELLGDTNYVQGFNEIA